MKMPFGKYKGKDIEEIPSSYLLWVAGNVKEDSSRNKIICEECDREWHWREKHGVHFEEGDM